MSLQYQYGQHPALQQDELHSLELVREFLAADVIDILSAVTRSTESVRDDGQTLLRAAVTDLVALDRRLQLARDDVLNGTHLVA